MTKLARAISKIIALSIVCAATLAARSASATWLDPAWAFRRPIEVIWDAEHGGDGELAYVEFLTAGHCKPDGTDVRIADDDGRIMPSRVLRIGPGDSARVLFTCAKNVKKYYAYFGNASPEPSKVPAAPDIKFGVLYEMKSLAGGPIDDFKSIEETWKRSKLIGATMIDRPFIGYNPLGDQERTIAKLTAQLFAPIEGDYFFAASADDRGALYIDDKPAIFAHAINDTRFNATLHLARGRHSFTMYHVNTGGPGFISVCWKRPDMAKIDAISRDAFGAVPRAQAGPLEEIKKSLTADFKSEPLGEFPTSEVTASYRFRFSANFPQKTNVPIKAEWDFGDGQHAEGEKVEHVFITEGVYPIRLTFHLGSEVDAQTNQFWAVKLFDRQNNPQVDSVPSQGAVVAKYDVATMPSDWLPGAMALELVAPDLDAAVRLLARACADAKHSDPAAVAKAVNKTVQACIASKRLDDAYKALDRVPANSDLQPGISQAYARLLLWRSADFPKACAMLAPLIDKQESLRTTYAQALLLNQKVDEARKIFAALPLKGPPAQQAALSGALARSIEYYLTEKDAESGEDSWETWQTRYPADFLQGYGALLRVRLMELNGLSPQAARVAEAFAAAVPTSSYAPALLDRASKLLTSTDASKSAALRQVLKQRYPEDPLSQD